MTFNSIAYPHHRKRPLQAWLRLRREAPATGLLQLSGKREAGQAVGGCPSPMSRESFEERLLKPSEMADLARRARAKAGLTQQEAAERLGVARPNISKAENDASGRYVKLQARMAEELAGWECEGPLWRARLPSPDE